MHISYQKLNFNLQYYCVILIFFKSRSPCLCLHMKMDLFINFYSKRTTDYWFSKCNNCDGILVERLRQFIDGIPLDSPVIWMFWRKDDTSKRTEKYEESGTLEDLLLHITQLSPQFLRHSYLSASNEIFLTNTICEEYEIISLMKRQCCKLILLKILSAWHRTKCKVRIGIKNR